MSTTVDNRVVEMRFDNKHFENNVQTSLNTLDKLKQSLKLDGAAKGLENVESAAKKVNLSGLSSAVETVGLKFNAMYTIADQALRNITNSAMVYGKRIVSALTIDPIKTGFSEYETQINAVQTILANTKSKGSTLDDVNGALDELNTYADKTIYNFTEMTRNIGTFTAAGVDLDKSVSSIKGIANLAAVSGSSSQQASTAMYQLSQALAAGKVQLMDWNSVVNAGMGGQLFQDALKRTAKNMGTDVDALIKKYGSFRESLTKGEWLTADVLTETLSQLAGAYTEADLLAKGYTKDQAREILELATTAEDAATKVKTFTQLWDTLKESAQSGWTQTWEILVGDFEEAKKLLTSVSEIIGGMISESADERNTLLQGWKDAGGRDDVIASLFNIFEAGLSIMTQVKEAFREIFPPMTVDQLVGLTESLKEFTKNLKPGTQTLTNLKNTFKGLFAILSIVKQAFSAIFSLIKPLFGYFDDLGGGILETTGSLGEWLVNLDKTIKETNVFGKAVEKIKETFKKVGEFLAPVIEGVKEFGSSLSETFSDVAEKAQVRFEPLKTLGEIIKGIFVGIAALVGKIFPYVSAAAQGIGKVFNELMGMISSSIQNTDYESLFDFANGGIITAIGAFIAKFIKSGGDILDNAGGFLENINNILDGVSEALNAFTESLKAKTLLTIAKAIGILAIALVVLSLIDSEKLNMSMTAITVLFGELMASMSLFSKMVEGKGIGSISKVASAMVSLSAALLVMAIALKIMSTMTWEEMGVGLISMTVGLGLLVGAVNLLPETKVNKAAKAIQKLSTAMLILAIAIKIMSTMTWEEMGIGLIAMVVGLGALVGAVNLLPKDTALKTAGLIGLATAMVIMGSALKIMATMSWEEMSRGLITLSGALAAIILAMMAMPRDVALKTMGMVGFATALVILGGALKIMGGMMWEEIARGLVALGGSLLIIAGAMALMRTALPGAAALIVVSAALAILTPVLMALGSMSLEEIGRGLLALAGAFTIVGVAGLLLKPLIPAILGLSAAILLLGVGIAAIGGGVMMLGIGLTAISAGGAALSGALVMIVSSVISLIPFLIEQIGLGIIKLCEVIAGSASALFEAASVIIVSLVDALVASVPVLVEGVFVLIDALLEALVEHTPTIVTALFDILIGIIEAVTEKLPELIKAGVEMVMAFFAGVVDALKSIDPMALLDGIVSIGLLSGLMYVLASVAALTPAAMTGVLGMAAVVTELGLVLAAIGALAQIPGLTWLIGEGGEFLRIVGNAIGQFLGGIVGGVAEGITASLPQIGTDLSKFMTNLKPFLDGANAIDPTTMEGVKSLVDVILALTAANLLESITSWFAGEASLAKFGQELAAFGPYMTQYAESVKGIDSETVTASANAAKALSEMAANIPNSGGLVGWFTGENDMTLFGTQLVAFGTSLKDYSTAVTGLNSEAITLSVSAATSLSEMAAAIPNFGGMVSWFTGENDLATFGSQLIVFGEGLKSYSESVVGIDTAAISASVTAAAALSELGSTLENSGGMVSWFAGDNDLATFGSNLEKFGGSMKAYSDKIEGISVAKMTTATTQFYRLANLAKDISSTDFGGLKSFGDALAKVGTDGINDFIDSFVNGYDEASTAVKEFIDVLIAKMEEKEDDFETRGSESMVSFAKGISDEGSSVVVLFTGLLTKIVATIKNKYESFYSAGSYLVTGFANGINDNTYKARAKATAMAAAAASAARKELDEHSPSKVGYEIGDFFGVAFVNGIADNVRHAYGVGSDIALSAKNGLSEAISRVHDFINSDMDVQPTIRPVLDLSDVRAGAGSIGNMLNIGSSIGVLSNVGAISSAMNRNSQNGKNGEVVGAINRLRKDLGNVGNNTYNINGVTYDDGSNVSDAVKVIVRAARVERRR